MASETYNFDKFQLISILNNNAKSKIVVCLGRFIDLNPNNQAIIIFEKTAFAEKNLSSSSSSSLSSNSSSSSSSGAAPLAVAKEVADDEPPNFFSESTKLTKTFVNDIYGNFDCYPDPKINSIKTTIIYPATEKHVAKYSIQELFIIQESAKDYQEKTLPYLRKEQFTLDWVYNILEHKKETDRIVYEDPCPINGFILLPDLKWDGKTLETLYLQAIIHKRASTVITQTNNGNSDENHRDEGIKSIRDLNGLEHLKLLKNIRDKSLSIILTKYGVKRSQLRIYFHYQPSFYHLHIHFTYLKYEAPGTHCEKSHILDTVISNLELMPDYYQRVELSFVVKKQHPLYEIYYPATVDTIKSTEEVDDSINISDADAAKPPNRHQNRPIDDKDNIDDSPVVPKKILAI